MELELETNLCPGDCMEGPYVQRPPLEYLYCHQMMTQTDPRAHRRSSESRHRQTHCATRT